MRSATESLIGALEKANLPENVVKHTKNVLLAAVEDKGEYLRLLEELKLRQARLQAREESLGD